MATTKPSETSKLQPITILDTDTAWLFSHIHPLFVLSSFILSFKSVVEDPVSSLTSLLLPLAAVQMFYVINCLSPVRASKPPPTTKVSVNRKRAGGLAASDKTENRISRRISVGCLIMGFKGPLT